MDLLPREDGDRRQPASVRSSSRVHRRYMCRFKASLVSVLVSVLVVAWTASCAAGPNEYGTLVFHVDPSVVLTDGETYCERSAVESCAEVIARADGSDPVVFWTLAAFIEGSSPRLAGVEFGIDYDPSATPLLAHAACGDFELPTSGWPDPGEGTAVTFTVPRTGTIEEVYWFAAYSYAGSATQFNLAPHPVHGAVFADDSIPSEIDPVARLGVLGFNAPGDVPCPAALGACCFPDGQCDELTNEECDQQLGLYEGDGTACDPNPCPPPPPDTGACCFDDGHCEVLPRHDCPDFYQGDDTTCDPHPCDPAGACCDLWGDCHFVIARACDEGQWLGKDVPCEPNPCEPLGYGACCGSDGKCYYVSNIVCHTLSGTIFHRDVPCDPDPCRGACCFGDECISEMVEQRCSSEGGQYQGSRTTCIPDPCDPVPVEDPSWGEIKARFR